MGVTLLEPSCLLEGYELLGGRLVNHTFYLLTASVLVCGLCLAQLQGHT